MQRLLVLAFGLACALGAVTFAVAQDASPTATPSTACASPVPATPNAGTPTVTATVAGTPSATPEACAPASAAVTIELVDIAFKPTEATIPAGGPATLTIQNNGLALHNFSIDALDISVDLGPGESETVTIDAPAGDYDYYCNIPGHAQAGMTGVLHIK